MSFSRVCSSSSLPHPDGRVSERVTGGRLVAGHSQPATNSYLNTCAPGPGQPQVKDSALAKNLGAFGGGIIMCSLGNARISVEKVEKSDGFQNWEIRGTHSTLSMPGH